MVQLGYNAGPRDLRVFQLAKSYTKNLDEQTKADHDKEVIAAVTITWATAKAWLPLDITNKIEDTLEENGLPPIATRNIPAAPGLRQTRSQTHAGSAPGQIDSTSEDFSKRPANGGGNFVDMTLKVVVHQAAGTLFAFNPAMGPGTTRLCDATNYLAAITFSSHIFKAFQMAQTGIIEAEDKAGDGNFD
ncbi:hypothetical protein R3P38DRAFT_3050165 [Favolaschia claudopus]|uniref:Uncharacterized protein n=1 Tax=Favolaschia claudopus TaxID=2862362 RepID=A0AAW0A551_9AGAR